MTTTHPNAAAFVLSELGRFALSRHESRRRRLTAALVEFCLVEGMIPLRVRKDFADLAGAIPGGMSPNHAGEEIHALEAAGFLQVDRPADEPTLAIRLQTDSRLWRFLQVCDGDQWRKRINRLREANGLTALELLPAEMDLNGALLEVSLARADGMAATALASQPAASRAVKIPDLGRKIPDLGSEIPNLGSKPGAAPIIPRARARAFDIESKSNVVSISKSNEQSLPDLGNSPWQSDGYILEKLRRFPKVHDELVSGRTARGCLSRLALEFAEFYRLDEQGARALIGNMASLPPHSLAGRPTNHAAWLNTAVTNQLAAAK